MIIDASALLALLYEEPGHEAVREAILEGAAMSAANLAEVSARLHQDGWKTKEVQMAVEAMKLDIVPVDSEIALLSGAYRPLTKSLGLSVGDRLCLATAKTQKVPALTADKAWLKAKIRGLAIQSIR